MPRRGAGGSQSGPALFAMKKLGGGSSPANVVRILTTSMCIYTETVELGQRMYHFVCWKLWDTSFLRLLTDLYVNLI